MPHSVLCHSAAGTGWPELSKWAIIVACNHTPLSLSPPPSTHTTLVSAFHFSGMLFQIVGFSVRAVITIRVLVQTNRAEKHIHGEEKIQGLDAFVL